MKTYDVKLELFEGPLDLLLYLIKKDEMDIKDISISDITSEYVHYIGLMKDLNLEMAGEFLVMASTLLQIKAKTLLPRESVSQESEEGPDPRAELVSKLLEYQKYKEAASILSQREADAHDIYYRNVLPVFSEQDLTLEASIFDLLGAFREVLKQAGDEIKELLYDEIPLEQKIREILDLFENEEVLQFNQLFLPNRSKREYIVTFLALLELMRLKQVAARQSESFSEIRIYRLNDQENNATVPEDSARTLPQENLDNDKGDGHYE